MFENSYIILWQKIDRQADFIWRLLIDNGSCDDLKIQRPFELTLEH